MAGLGCFIKDTSVVNDIKDVMLILAGASINDGKRFTIQDAYKYLRKNDVEVDVESVAAIYEETFYLGDGNFSSQNEVYEFSGRAFADTLDNLVNAGAEPEGAKQIGLLSPGKAAAKQIVDFFISGNQLSEKPKSLMVTFQKLMKNAAMRVADKTVLPEKPSKKETRTFNEILSDALDFQDNTGFLTVNGTLNNAEDLAKEFKAEVQKYINELRSKGENIETIDQFEAYANQMVNSTFSILLSQKEAKDVVIGALIEKGFAKQKKDGTKDIDWDKLSEKTGMPNFIKNNVTAALQEKGFTPEQINRINNELIKEYNEITAYVIERAQEKLRQENAKKSESAQKELERRNKVTKRQQSIDAKRMARLYNLGFFDLTPRTYENLLNRMVGMSDINQSTFDQLKTFGQALSTLYATKVVSSSGQEFDAQEFFFRDAINSMNEKIGSILRQNQNSNSAVFKLSRVFDNYISAGMRMVLTGARNMLIQNPMSGFFASKTSDLFIFLTEKSDTAELREQRKKFSKAVFNDMVFDRGEHYGDVSSTFYARNSLDHLKNKIDDAITGGVGKRSKAAQAVLSFLTGKIMLDAMDSRFKANIAQKYLINNIYKILTAPNNPNKLTKEEASRYILEQLSNYNFDKAYEQAESFVNKINQNQPKKILSDEKPFLTRLANDLIKANLVARTSEDINPPISAEQLAAAYEAAYKAAGRDLGHVANNWISVSINATGGAISSKIDQAVKDKQYNTAAIYTIANSLYKNMINPFVGGATNWIVLGFEKMGGGIIAGGIKTISNRLDGKTIDKIDLSDSESVKELSDVLYEENVQQMKMARGVVGGLTSALLFLIGKYAIYSIYGGGSDEEKDKAYKEYEKWKKENQVVAKYIDAFSSEWLLLSMAIENKELNKYFTRMLSMDNPNAPSAKIGRAVQYAQQNKDAYAYGQLGEVAGNVINVPVPWRFFRDIVEFGQWTTGKYEPKEYIKSRSFMQGLLKNGMLYQLGYKYEPEYDITALPGMGQSGIEAFEKINIKTKQDLDKLIGLNIPIEKYKSFAPRVSNDINGVEMDESQQEEFNGLFVEKFNKVRKKYLEDNSVIPNISKRYNEIKDVDQKINAIRGMYQFANKEAKDAMIKKYFKIFPKTKKTKQDTTSEKVAEGIGIYN